ncbi:3-oxoacyl-[acyl-carrier-protein] synthase III C-terminal domain-containing protein [Pseudomonas sp. S09G 359]|jgi:3-oxoacyl-[acyl-carrier-protein] synthase III|uniref:3-oxoacyl-[acyl-carrier-protein] synthase III C-terminal domain-containing protein n=1 Tax=Pseudomonas sp. S09G 359 TaxID=2054919 RepID=UPI000C6CB899|nr:3-oxoacyl-[acyl-carrier-protein] synthase III C-terminal domain-containing protein [Pseudomonas sp. S09G 359]AUG08680.1 3-oxoacyl-ACP reductase [Pseudomonas sp. S09G 359]
MKIAGLSAVLPSRTVGNLDIQRLVTELSPTLVGEELNLVLRRINFFLTFSGARERRWLAEGERPFELLSRAVSESLAEAQLKPSAIELIIYTGVDRGFLEPAMAYMVGSALGMPNAHCFDIVDACMSWTRAAFVVSNLMATNCYRNALIVNCECSMRAGGRVFPGCFNLTKIEQVEHNLAAYTIGEAASATVLVKDDGNPWEFHFSSENGASDLCAVPLDAYDLYCQPTDKLGCNGVNSFYSFASEMFDLGKPHALAIFEKLSVSFDSIKAIFPHAASLQAWWEMGCKLNVQDKIQFIYPEYGNLVSASIPVALAKARNTKVVEEGDYCAGWVGSAGMSFASFGFRL